MQIFALFMLCGCFTTLLIPETKRKTLEELAGEVPGTPNYDPVVAGHVGKINMTGNEVAGSNEAAGSNEGEKNV
jgi:MFS transporter, PHS family, inorganic phosphate transporter